MRIWSKRGRGFTLIELLIVVAIIAILAMIAVPNFLEAQTRAKVSRVKNDLRSLATAEEAYFVDWNSYTKYDRGGDDFWPDGSPAIEGWKQLTTPVAYITSIPHDPFGLNRTQPAAARASAALYELGTGAVGIGPGAPQASGTPDRPMIRPTDSWIMNSNGPDRLDQTGGTAQGNTYGWTEWHYPWVNLNANAPLMVIEALGLVYDPTNGTVSRGDIFRCGGQKPPGAAYEVLWAASAR